MPINVRCSGCQKALRVPDTARGKVVRCPECGRALKIPAGTAEPKQEKVLAPKPAQDETGFFGSLDLSKAEDTRVRLCPKCGTEMGEEDTECPFCGIDPSTGQLTVAARKRATQAGPDESEYYRDGWKDARQFRRDNSSWPIRTSIYLVLFALLTAGSLYMVTYCQTTPPKTFWVFVTFVTMMMGPGWVWRLHTEVISATFARKDRLSKIHGDLFLNTALGIKVFLWFTVFSLPFLIVTGICGVVLSNFVNETLGWAVMLLGYLPAWLMFPIAMAHMSMPVTYRAWLTHQITAIFLKTVKPVLYWQMWFLFSMLPTFAVLGAMGVVWFADFGLEEMIKQIVVASLAAVAAVTFSYAAILNMRTNGKFAYYFKKTLSLITQVKETKYVPKAKPELDAHGKVKVPPAKSFAIAMGVMSALGLAGGSIYGFTSGEGFLVGVFFGLWWAGVIISIIGGLIILGAAYGKSFIWGLAVFFLGPFGSLAFIITHWEESKWGFFMQLVGAGLMFLVIILVFVTAATDISALMPLFSE